jgi:hypothetical protein
VECTRTGSDSAQFMQSAHRLRTDSAQSVQTGMEYVGECKLLQAVAIAVAEAEPITITSP